MKAVNEVRQILESRAMFLNPHPFSENESDEAAFFHCIDEEASRLFCPNRRKAMQTWIEATTKVDTFSLTRYLLFSNKIFSEKHAITNISRLCFHLTRNETDQAQAVAAFLRQWTNENHS